MVLQYNPVAVAVVATATVDNCGTNGRRSNNGFSIILVLRLYFIITVPLTLLIFDVFVDLDRQEYVYE